MNLHANLLCLLMYIQTFAIDLASPATDYLGDPAIQYLPDNVGDRGNRWATDHGVAESVTTKQKYLQPWAIYISEG